jgi:GNAT superfamily N-acetyltransferase
VLWPVSSEYASRSGARISDYTTLFAYLCDVYVLREHRGKGLGKWLMECVMMHPEFQNLKRFSPATRDAHDFYRHFSFQPLAPARTS